MNHSKRRAQMRKIPWKALAANMGVVGAAHALGYMASGATANLLARTPGVQNHWNRMTPQQQRGVATIGVGVAGSLIPLATMGSNLASSANLMDAYEKARRDEEAEDTGEKTAQVLEVYRLALDRP